MADAPAKPAKPRSLGARSNRVKIKSPGRKTPFALTPKQEQFAREFAKCGQGAKSARAAGFGVKQASSAACQLLDMEKVDKRIRELKTAQWRRMQMSADEVLAGIANIARFDIRALFDEDGGFIPVTEWPEHAAKCVAGIEIREKIESIIDANGEESQAKVISTRITKIKTDSRIAALDTLTKHLRLVDPKHQNPDDVLPIEILQAVARMRREQLLEFLAGTSGIARPGTQTFLPAATHAATPAAPAAGTNGHGTNGLNGHKPKNGA